MMLRSPLPAAAASHTASHVSFPLFFFFLTSARGGAATARPLTSPLLMRPRPGWGEGRGRPRRERVPRGPGLRDEQGGAVGLGGGRRWGALMSPRSRPPARGTQRARLAGAPGWGRPRSWPSGPPTWSEGAAPRVRAGSFLLLAAPPRDPGPKAVELRLREKVRVGPGR